jgi:hypothetical protein
MRSRHDTSAVYSPQSRRQRAMGEMAQTRPTSWQADVVGASPSVIRVKVGKPSNLLVQ